MKVIDCNLSGDSYQLSLGECHTPSVDEHDILIKVAASGVNRADIYQAQGSYPAPKGASPILGLEVSGEVIQLGSKVRSHSIGDKVCALLQGGGYAQYVSVPEYRALAIPENMDIVTAGGIMETYSTAYLNLMEIGKLQPGQTVLIHGGASGVGTAAIQISHHFGCKVITTAGSKKKCEICRSIGADYAINYKKEDFVSLCKEITGGKGVDLVLDMVGGDYIQKNLKVLKYAGKMISIAFIKGSSIELDISSILMKNITYIGSTLRSKDEEFVYDLLQSLREIVWPLFESGQIKPVIDSVYKFADVQRAHYEMIDFKHAGKIILDHSK